MMKRILLCVFALTFTTMFALPVNYQGKLTTTGGVGINDTFHIAMSIWDAPSAGTMVDTDTLNDVIVYHGLFAEIFDITIPPAYISGPLYIQISIDTTRAGDWATVTPRQLITTEFRAMWTDNSVNAIYADTAYFVLAESVYYDNTVSGLTSTDVQGAIDELAASVDVSLQDAYDNGETIYTTANTPVVINDTISTDNENTLEIRGNDDQPSLYVYNAGSGPAIYSSGSLRMSGAAGVRIFSTGDLNFQLDEGGGPGTTNSFAIRDDADAIFFEVNENGEMTTNAIIAIDSIQLGGVWRSTWPTGGGADSNYIQNQDTIAQPAKFWAELEGNFGTYMTATENNIWTDDFEDADISDWDTTDYLSGGAVWTITNPGALPEYGGCTGTFLSVDDDNMGSGVTTEASAISPIVDLSPYSGNPIYLEFNHFFNNISSDVGSLFVYDGASWVLIAEFNADDSGLVSYDISTYANANFQIKYKYNDDGSWAWYWMVDNIRIYYVTYSTPAPTIVANGPTGNLELRTSSGDVIFDGTGLKTSGGAGIVGYDNSTSGLVATDVQTAIDEIVGIAAGGKDTLWTVSENPADTMVVMAQTKINGELIADSIQAVSDTVYFDDNISVKCAKFGGGAAPSTIIWNEDFESGIAAWTITNTSSGGSGVPDWTDTNPGGRTASGGCTGTFLIADSDNYGFGIMNTRAESPVFDCSGYLSVTLTFDGYFNGYSSSDDAGSLFVFDGTTWQLLDAWEDNDYYGPFSYDITAYANANCQIAVQYYGDYAMYWMVDNFEVSALTGAAPPAVEICAGNINADGNLDIGGNTTIGDTLKVAHYRDSAGDNLLRSSDGSVSITEDADGSWNLTTLAGGGCVTLDGAYDCGGSGIGYQIFADAGPVEIDAIGSTNGALNVLASDPAVSALYINHIGGGNGIWNDANYFAPTGNIALGTGIYTSNQNFVVRIDADNDADNAFIVENSAGAPQLVVDEYGNSIVSNNLSVLGGIDDGVSTGSAGDVLTADGTGHFHWATPTGGGGFQQLRADGSAWLTDSVTLVSGTNITLTQTGDSITIDATGGAADNDWARAGNLLTTYNITDSVGIGVAAPQYKLHVEGETDDYEAVGYFKNTSSPGDYIDGYGVYGECANDDYYGYGVYGVGGYVGVEGDVYPTGSDYYYGVYGYVDGGDGENYGVVGDVYGDGVNYGVYAYATDNGSGTSNNYGIYAYAAGGDTNWAGYFVGDVYVDMGIDIRGGGGGAGGAGASTYRDDWENANVITVAPDNADFASIDFAIAAAGAGPAIIKIAPGTYTLSADATIPTEVVLFGSGQQNTIITTSAGAVLTFNLGAEAYFIHFDLDVNFDGTANQCWFSGNTQIGGTSTFINSCTFDDMGGTDTLAMIDGGKVEQCNINMPTSCFGYWNISDCNIGYNGMMNIQPSPGGLSEVHIDGCDIFAPITITGIDAFAYIESNRLTVTDGPPAIYVTENGFAEIKANHFIDCNIGVEIGTNASGVILSNDFMANVTFAINADTCTQIDVIGNDIDGMSIGGTGIRIDGAAESIIKDNQISECNLDAIWIGGGITTILDNNSCIGNRQNGIYIDDATCQILRNTLINNGDGTSTFDLNDASPTPASVASYNVLDTYNPAGTGVFAGAFNTNSFGVIYPGAQPGQLP